ncbi:MAG TPA: glycerophosphodiester phosphodiesterase family protein [Haloplasmataceae bacterium]
MKVFKAFLAFILVILAVIVFLEIIPVAPKYKGENPWLIKEGEKPLIIPHGGAKTTYPENTIYAFKKLVEAGYDVFEVDLVLTKDNILITHHDTNLVNTTKESLLINNLTYDEIVNKYINSDFAEKFKDYNGQVIENVELYEREIVPATLEYLFQTYSTKRFILEIKDTIINSGNELYKEAVDILLDLITTYNMEDKVIVSSFDDQVMKYFKQKSQGLIFTATASQKSAKFVILSLLRLDFFYNPQDVALILPYNEKLKPTHMDLMEKVPGFIKKELTTYKDGVYYTNLAKKYIINDAHRHNMAIYYWTVNDKIEIKKLIEMGVDGIITDRPDLVIEVFNELGLN